MRLLDKFQYPLCKHLQFCLNFRQLLCGSLLFLLQPLTDWFQELLAHDVLLHLSFEELLKLLFWSIEHPSQVSQFLAELYACRRVVWLENFGLLLVACLFHHFLDLLKGFLHGRDAIHDDPPYLLHFPAYGLHIHIHFHELFLFCLLVELCDR